MAPQILLFAGTSEGRRLAERLSAHGISFYVSVATAYGETLLEHAHASILQGRMDREEIIAFLRAHPVECVVDATHPYAALATEHIRGACREMGTEYLRLLREESEDGWREDCALCLHRAGSGAIAQELAGKYLIDDRVKRAFGFYGSPGLCRTVLCADAPYGRGRAEGVVAWMDAGASDLYAGTLFRGAEPRLAPPARHSGAGDQGIGKSGRLLGKALCGTEGGGAHHRDRAAAPSSRGFI